MRRQPTRLRLAPTLAMLGMLLCHPPARAQESDPADPAEPAAEAETAPEPPPPAAPAELPRLLVLETKITGVPADSGVDKTALTNLCGSIISGVRRYKMLDAEGLASLLDQEQQKQLTGCDDASCMAEIGAALGARYLVYSNVGRVGDSFVTTVSQIDTKEGSVTSRQTIAVHDVRQIVDAMAVTTKRLMGLQAELPPLPPPEGTDWTVWKWTTLGAGVAVAVLVAAGAGLAVHNRNQADSADDQDDFDNFRDKGDTWNIVSITGYAVGGALLATSVVFFILDAVGPAEREATEAGGAASLTPLPGGGAMLNAAWRF